MTGTRTLLVALLIAGVALVSVQASSGDELIGFNGSSAIPLPVGREMSDGELLEVEGDLGFFLSLLILTAIGATAAAGGAAVHENWFDEDYGIDRDDWREIGSAAVQGAIGGCAGALGARWVPM